MNIAQIANQEFDEPQWREFLTRTSKTYGRYKQAIASAMPQYRTTGDRRKFLDAIENASRDYIMAKLDAYDLIVGRKNA
jgi:hypothetical protein